jgi:phosphate starvation-inducible PhoH-like protein
MRPMKPTEIVLHPLDNVRLANLCGALDENIRQIETAFDVTIARRSERFTMQGASAQTHHAARALRHFYEKADAPCRWMTSSSA